ncbi:FUSC family protein [[Eubacterium] tenue]|nr:FUSC family protein [[Eubacterium] tenue]MBC8630485.1 FUSC family protein [[Eubacterium] tenue]
MDKKKIIPTTIMFLAIVSIIIAFKFIFGDENTLVGVVGVTAALSLLGTDYTINPIKNTLYFVAVEVGIGIFSYIASINSLLGLIITFIVIFFVLYEFTYNTKKPTYIAFTLAYLFMLYTPISINELPNRLLAFAVCGLSIMALQMLINKNKLQKQSKSIIKSSIESINEEISLVINDKKSDEIINLNTKIYNDVKNLSADIYERIDKNIELPIKIIQVLFISEFLESINLTLRKINDDKSSNSVYNKVLNEILDKLKNINDFIDEKITIDEIIKNLENFSYKEKHIDSNYYLIFELQEAINLLVKDLKNTKENSIKQIYKNYFVTNMMDRLNNLKLNINKESLKFTFALRGAIVTSIAVFIVSAFNIEHGKWLIFSISAIVQPYLESSKTKGKERILGTIIGLIIFEIVFSIITNTSQRAIIILLVGYISNYQSKYKYQMICTTISALGAASIGTDITDLSIQRITFVILGTIIALYANKVILPYKMSIITKNDIKKSIEFNEKIVTKLYNLGLSNVKLDNEIKELLVVNELINKKINTNNLTLLSSDINEFLYNQRIFMNDIRFLTNNFREYNKTAKDKLKLFYDVDLIMNKENSKEDIKNYFDKLEDKFSKLILIDIIGLKENIINSKCISKSILKEA